MLPLVRLVLLLAGGAACIMGCLGVLGAVFLVVYNWDTFGNAAGIDTAPLIAGTIVPIPGIIAVLGYVVFRLAQLLPKRHPADWRGPRGFNVVVR